MRVAEILGIKSFVRYSFLLLFFILSLFLLNGNSQMPNYDTEEFDLIISDMETRISVLRSSLEVDSIRIRTIYKITDIMNNHNSSMDYREKMRIAGEIYNASLKYPNLDIDFICATITQESAQTWDPEIISPAGAMGLMQVMPNTGKFISEEIGIDWISKEDILYDPILNIRIGACYLSMLVESFGKEGGLAAYNGGPRLAKKFLRHNKNYKILYRETRKYIPRVLAFYEEYKSL